MIRNSIIYVFMSCFLLGSCDDFFDVNETPNNPIDVPPEVLLPTVLAASGFINSNELNRFGSTIAVYLAGAGGSPRDYDLYDLNSNDFGNQWNFEIYGGAITDSQQLIDIAEADGASHYVGIAKILQAYAFSVATDCWGDVPYSQSPSTTINQPRFDAQEDIYLGNESLEIQSLFDLVREGVEDLKSASTLSPGTEDIAFNGDIDSWIRTGNTLLLKLANTISIIDPPTAVSIINEVLADGQYIDSNSEDFNINFGTSVGSQAPVFTYTRNSLFSDDLIMSSRFLTLLQDSNDPRLSLYFTSPGGTFQTIDNGENLTAVPDDEEDFSKYNDYVTGANGEGPVRILTNFQVQFILAESALNLSGFSGSQSVSEYYENGIRASMELAGVDPTNIDIYIAANTLSSDPNIALEQIITQKYIAWCGNGLEAWNDWRRTGFPVLAESQNAVGIDGTRPVRLLYTNDEINANPNVPDPVPQTNVRVWWDVN
ncbi:MAG: SusD/RagB family nutrient-binding outer membrane lipoprotein [Bacteroidota bacterium]